MTRRLAALAALLLALVAPRLAAQQAAPTQCTLNEDASRPTRLSYDTRSGVEVLFVGGGAVVRCPDRDITLYSDSAEYYGDRRVWYLIGSVRYREPRMTLDSRRLTYWMAEERLLAEGDVVSRLPSGTTMRGPQAEYFRAVPGVRTRARMVATGRPRFELVQVDSAGRPSEPVELIADRVVTEGDSIVFARGRVEITRPDVFARGDSAIIDSGRGWARLLRQPSIVGRGQEPFTLTGVVIDLYSEDRRLRRVLSSGEAAIDSDDLDLRSDTIDLRLEADQLQRAFAWGPSRARAVSTTSDILADSLDVHLPNQRLTEVRAMGNAFAQSTPDTSRMRTEERDWMRGDSLIARFDTTARVAARSPGSATVGPDTLGSSELRELLASGTARSYYQVASEDSLVTQPSVNYVTGQEMFIMFAEGRVRQVTVTGQTFGVLLQPGTETSRNATPQRDAAPPDTGTTRPTPRPTTAPPRLPVRPPSGPERLP